MTVAFGANSGLGASQASWPSASAELDLTGRIDGLQWARAIAAICVVVTHAIAHPYPGAPGAVHLLGRFGVTLFFVISGFIMVLTTGPSRFDPISFMQRRLVRIVPLYAIATLIVAAGALLAPWAFKDTVFSVSHTIYSLLFIPAYEPGGSGRIDPVLRLGWTLNFEMFFYLVFACLYWLGASARALALTAFYGFLIGLGLMFDFKNPILAFHTQIDSLSFVAGVWLALYAVKRKVPIGGSAFVIGFAVALFNLALMAALYGWVKEAMLTQVWLVLICTGLTALFALRPSAFEVRGGRSMVFLGDASYAIYLFHMFGVGAVTAVSVRLMPAGALYPMMAVAFVVGLAIGTLVYVILERPLQAALRGR